MCGAEAGNSGVVQSPWLLYGVVQSLAIERVKVDLSIQAVTVPILGLYVNLGS